MKANWATLNSSHLPRPLSSVLNPSCRATNLASSKPDKSIYHSCVSSTSEAHCRSEMSHPDAPLPDEKYSHPQVPSSTPLTARSDQPIDLSLYLHGSIDEKRHVARALLNSLRKNGFARLRNHGIEKSVISEAFHLVNRHFFLENLFVSRFLTHFRAANSLISLWM